MIKRIFAVAILLVILNTMIFPPAMAAVPTAGNGTYGGGGIDLFTLIFILPTAILLALLIIFKIIKRFKE